MPLPLFVEGGGGKIFGPAFKSNVQKGGKPSPLFGGGMEKSLVWHSKVMSKTSLNPENHVYSSNGMAVTEVSIFTI